MLDFNYIPNNTDYIQRFEANSPTAGAGWYTWVKPRGIKFVHLMMLGGGGGGSPGVVGAVSTAGGGGGGGSSSFITNLFPAHVIPDTLYVSVGFGGAASAAPGTVASTGMTSYVSIYSSLLTTPISYSMLGVAPGGLGASIHSIGSAGAGGVGGGGAAVTIATQNLSILGLSITGLAGIVGSAGGSTSFGVNPLFSTAGQPFLQAGGGGGLGAAASTGNIGGGFIGNNVFPALSGGAVGGTTTANGNDGSNGIQPIPGLFYFYGGSGGASGGGAGGNGGRGGYGAYGCGGGGGGAALTGFTAGAGGNGGNGLVIISCW